MSRLSNQHEALLNAAMYGIIFSKHPADDVERIVDLIKRTWPNDPNRRPQHFVAAIDTALKSDAKLSKLLPQPHSEAVIREYFLRLKQRLESKSE